MGDPGYLERYLLQNKVKSTAQYRQVAGKLNPAETMCREGLVEMASFWTEKTNASFDLNPVQCMRQAVKNGQPRMVNYLLSTYTSSFKDSDCHF